MKTIIVDKKGKQLPQEKLNELTEEYKKEYSPHQDYNLGYLHGLLREEDRQVLSSIMADGLFFGIHLAKKHGLRLKRYEAEDDVKEVGMYG